MKRFEGFPAQMDYSPVPRAFLSRVLPGITDAAEIKASLHLFAAIAGKRGFPRFVSLNELLRDTALVNGIHDRDEPPEATLRRALDRAVERGTFLEILLEGEADSQRVYLLNTAADREAVDSIRSGKIKLPGTADRRALPPETPPPPPNVFALYEQNIGLLTPMIAEELRDAEKQYPEQWIGDAIREAANLNKRNWRYIARILENWKARGRSDPSGGKDDLDKYVKGKYGHMVNR